MFEDARSKKIILVSHCILNQNVKIDRCAWYPGAIREVTQTILDAGVGFIQMPCPELLCVGLDRQAERGVVTTIESEDDRVAERMEDEKPRQICRKLVGDLVDQIEQYRLNGFTVLGVLGINGSPTCGVEKGWANGGFTETPGVLIEALTGALAHRGITLPMRGLRARDPVRAVQAIKGLIG
jgi:predicted secreted protein